MCASPAKGERSFCLGCGTSLTFIDPGDPGFVDVALASLDDPAASAPESHIWTMSRIRWLDLKDELPRYTGASDA